ncbi:hypothetical protein J6590_077015 [Homalodisca vitripennis]|nr:hypothetical protein J6590_077015 [Homalodisca vitripennis]
MCYRHTVQKKSSKLSRSQHNAVGEHGKFTGIITGRRIYPYSWRNKTREKVT